MTTFKPSILIDHMSVLKSGQPVYQGAFHAGLNIISGSNSSGKSSIMDFLFFGLGGDLTERQWREASLLCDRVMIGAEMSGHKVTLSRDIEPVRMRPMEIFFGPYEEAQSAPRSAWQKFPYARGGGQNGKESFSQVLFRLLGLPEVRIDEQNVKITMHQLLRVLYSDQLTSVERIFRQQQPDDAITRSTVGDILMGAYSEAFYSATLRLKDATDELKGVDGQIRQLLKRYHVDGQPLTEDWISAETAKLNSELADLAKEILVLESQIFEGQFDDRLTLNDQERTLETVRRLQSEIGELSVELDAVEMEIVDAEEFIAQMDKKVADLTNANAVVDEFEYLAFDHCPACMALVEEHSVEGGCSLCKQAFDKASVVERSAKMLNEAIRQRDRSIEIQKDRREERDNLLAQITAKTSRWEEAGRHYRVALRSPTTEMRSKLREKNREAGYKGRQLEELSGRQAVLAEMKLLRERSQDLQEEIAGLASTIETEKKKNLERKSSARASIEERVIEFLKDDLDRQSTFKEASRVDFDFDGDRLSANEESYFSASSMVYLRNSFLAAFHFSAANDAEFGHPRLLLMDTVEDKGMEQERSQNFQRLLAKRSRTAESRHQVILATSMIAEELDNEEFVVGPKYSSENRTLRIQTRTQG